MRYQAALRSDLGGGVNRTKGQCKGARAAIQGYRIWPMMDFAKSPDHPARLCLAGDGEFGAGFSQRAEGKLAQKAEGFRAVVFAVAGAVLVEGQVGHPVQAVPDQPTGACGFRDGFDVSRAGET